MNTLIHKKQVRPFNLKVSMHARVGRLAHKCAVDYLPQIVQCIRESSRVEIKGGGTAR